MKCQKSKTEMKNACNRLISRLDTFQKRNNKLENRSMETSPAETQTEKKMKQYPGTMGL